jgi:hypothetical protein
MKIEANGPAFPHTDFDDGYENGTGMYTPKDKGGLTVRAWMATQILATMGGWSSNSEDAAAAIERADALIAALNKNEEKG